jgi:hypothetical protein
VRGNAGVSGWCQLSLVSLPLVFALAACSPGGDGGKDDGAVSTTTPPTPTTTTGAADTTTTLAITTTTPGDAASSDRRTVSLTRFQTPTHNIACALDADGVRCDIADKTWAPPPKPADCELDWGAGLFLTAKARGVVCAGDTVLDSSVLVLAYGDASRAGDFVCTSEQTGMTCVHQPTAHGFLLSRQRYQLF